MNFPKPTFRFAKSGNRTTWFPPTLLRSLAAFLIPFVVYLLTLAPSIVTLDSAELTTTAATLGISRSTGYPFYTLLGHLFSYLPVGDVAYRMNLFSALMGALSILLIDRIFQHLNVNAPASFGAAGLLAFSPYFWSLSLVAEVYTLNTALISGALLAVLCWIEKPTFNHLAISGFLLGLGLAHHGSFVLVLPGLLFLAAASHPKTFFQSRSLLVFFTTLAAGLLFYLYLPIRFAMNPAFNYAGHFDSLGNFHPIDLTTLSGLWWLVSGRTFASSMFAYSASGLAAQIQLFLGQITRGFFFIGIGPAVLGILASFKRSWQLGIALLVMFSFCAFFYLDYDLADKATMFLPCYVVMCIWIGLGYQFLLTWVNKSLSNEIQHFFWQRIIPITLQVFMVTAVIVSCLQTWTSVDRSQDWSARQRGENLLRTVKPGAVVVGYWDSIPVLQYLTLVENQRHDLLLINRFLISDSDLEALIGNLVGKRPFYIDDRPDRLPDGIIEQPSADMIELVPLLNQYKN
jgi:hypothetical protein